MNTNVISYFHHSNPLIFTYIHIWDVYVLNIKIDQYRLYVEHQIFLFNKKKINTKAKSLQNTPRSKFPQNVKNKFFKWCFFFFFLIYTRAFFWSAPHRKDVMIVWLCSLGKGMGVVIKYVDAPLCCRGKLGDKSSPRAASILEHLNFVRRFSGPQQQQQHIVHVKPEPATTHSIGRANIL